MSLPCAFGSFECEFLTEPGDDRLILITRSTYKFRDTRGIRWFITPGRAYDGASIPWPLWSFVGGPFEGNHRIPALLHDEAYREQNFSREETDLMFYDALRFYGVGKFKAALIYRAVRIFGARPWESNQRARRAR